MKRIIPFFVALSLIFILIPGCNFATSTTSGLPDGMGKLVVNVTDPPPPDMDSVMVKVEKLEVHRAGGPWTTVAEDMEPFDLKVLEDREELLASAIVDPGIYTQIRLEIVSVTIWVDGQDYPAKVPSGNIKLVGSFEVVEGEETEVTLDFIGAQSVHVTGNGQYIFKPVIKLDIPESAKPGNGESETLSALLDQSETGALAELSTDPAADAETEAIHLQTTGDVNTGNEARIVIFMPEDTTLEDIDSISWSAWTVDGYPPHVDVVLDVNDNSTLDDEDMLTAEMAYNNSVGLELDEGLTPTLGEWLQTFELTSGDGYGVIDNDTMLWVTKMGAGNDDAPYGTLAEWKAGTGFVNPEPDSLPDPFITWEAKVLRIEIEIDNWVLQSEAYVKGIEIVIDGTTYIVEF
jgi:hypothetical protein